MISMIVATASNNVIGSNNQMPWHIPEDLAYFKQKTLNKTVVMGRKTFESIGKPLPQRTNIVLTRDMEFSHPEVMVYRSAEKLLEDYKHEELVIIGGAQIYALFYPYAQRLDITLIDQAFEGDIYFVAYEKDFEEVSRSERYEMQGITYRYTVWERKNK